MPIFCNRCLYCELYNVLCECGKKGISLDRAMAFAFPSHLLHLHVFYFNIQLYFTELLFTVCVMYVICILCNLFVVVVFLNCM